MQSLKTTNFSLQHSLESGQFFRYQQQGKKYCIQTQNKIIEIEQEKNKLHFNFLINDLSLPQQKKFLTTFFSLDEDFNKIKKVLQKDPLTKQALNEYSGMRILRQDSWECTIGFICSQVSNIPKIRKNMELLSMHFGNPIQINQKQFYHFPEIGTLKDLQKLQACAVGFRAKYLHAVNEKINKETLKQIEKMNYVEAKQSLMQLQGIGSKIADCILLFSYHKLEAFPVDVWVKRAMEEWYFKKETKEKEIQRFAQDYFGKYAGYAQQYLFHKRRLQNN